MAGMVAKKKPRGITSWFKCFVMLPIPPSLILPLPPSFIAVVVIAGTTAVGKTSLSLELARRLNGEVVSTDSVQVYPRVSYRVSSDLRTGLCIYLSVCIGLKRCNTEQGYYACMCLWSPRYLLTLVVMGIK